MQSYLLARQAEIEILEIFEYIATQSPQEAGHVRRAFYSTFTMISQHPLAAPSIGQGSTIRKKGGVGKIRNYVIYYDIAGNRVEILRVVHAARDQSAALEELD